MNQACQAPYKDRYDTECGQMTQNSPIPVPDGLVAIPLDALRYSLPSTRCRNRYTFAHDFQGAGKGILNLGQGREATKTQGTIRKVDLDLLPLLMRPCLLEMDQKSAIAEMLIQWSSLPWDEPTKWMLRASVAEPVSGDRRRRVTWQC